MIRFVLKSAFFLGLVAMVMPSLTGRSSEAGTSSTGIDVFSTLSGAQAALSDLSGFCGRAPDACAAGGDLARFAAERVGDGIQMAYGFLDASVDPRSTLQKRFAGVDPKAGRTDPAVAAAGVRARDAMATGAVTRALTHDRPTTAAPTRGPVEAVAKGGFDMPAVAGVAVRDPAPRALIPASRSASRLPIPSPAPRA